MTVTAGAKAATVRERDRPVDADEVRCKANWVRPETTRLIDQAGLGHDAGASSRPESLAVLYTLRLDPADERCRLTPTDGDERLRRLVGG